MYQISGKDIANRMLMFLFFLDFVLSIMYTIGRSAMPYDGLCQLQVLIVSIVYTIFNNDNYVMLYRQL